MLIETLVLGPCMTNCYIISSDNKNCIVVDPGDNASRIYNKISALSLNLTAVLLTHGHFDHIFAIAELCDLLNNPDLPVYIHKDDSIFLSDVNYNLSYSLFGVYYTFSGNIKIINDGDLLCLHGMTFKVMHTPGHTPGSVCYIIENIIFTGDTLFASTIGRTDFPGGDYPTIFNSLKKFKSLSDDYILYPGHNASTTLSREKLYNEYLQF